MRVNQFFRTRVQNARPVDEATLHAARPRSGKRSSCWRELPFFFLHNTIRTHVAFRSEHGSMCIGQRFTGNVPRILRKYIQQLPCKMCADRHGRTFHGLVQHYHVRFNTFASVWRVKTSNQTKCT